MIFKRRRPFVAKSNTGLVLLCLGILGAYAVLNRKEEPATQNAAIAPPAPSCKSSWGLCETNEQLAHEYEGFFSARFRCRAAAEKAAKYSTPKWGTVYFSKYFKGNSIKADGSVTLIDEDARFSNGFGAYVAATVDCHFSFKTGEVIDIRITEK